MLSVSADVGVFVCDALDHGVEGAKNTDSKVESQYDMVLCSIVYPSFACSRVASSFLLFLSLLKSDNRRQALGSEVKSTPTHREAATCFANEIPRGESRPPIVTVQVSSVVR